MNTKHTDMMRQLEQVAATLHPEQAFVQSLDARLRATTPHRRHSSARWPRVAFVAASLVAVLTAAVLSVPSLRAIAQEIVDLITWAESDEIEQEIILNTAAEIQTFRSLEEAESTIGRSIPAPLVLPSGRLSLSERTARVQSITYSTAYDSTQIRYEYGYSVMWWMWLDQMPIDVYQQYPRQIGQSAIVENVMIQFLGSRIQAQVIRGGWTITEDPLTLQELEQDAAPGDVQSVDTEWDNDSGAIQLTWQADGYVYSLHSVTEDVLNVDEAELIRIAENME